MRPAGHLEVFHLDSGRGEGAFETAIREVLPGRAVTALMDDSTGEMTQCLLVLRRPCDALSDEDWKKSGEVFQRSLRGRYDLRRDIRLTSCAGKEHWAANQSFEIS